MKVKKQNVGRKSDLFRCHQGLKPQISRGGMGFSSTKGICVDRGRGDIFVGADHCVLPWRILDGAYPSEKCWNKKIGEGFCG